MLVGIYESLGAAGCMGGAGCPGELAPIVLAHGGAGSEGVQLLQQHAAMNLSSLPHPSSDKQPCLRPVLHLRRGSPVSCHQVRFTAAHNCLVSGQQTAQHDEEGWLPGSPEQCGPPAAPLEGSPCCAHKCCGCSAWTGHAWQRGCQSWENARAPATHRCRDWRPLRPCGRPATAAAAGAAFCRPSLLSKNAALLVGALHDISHTSSPHRLCLPAGQFTCGELCPGSASSASVQDMVMRTCQ